MISTDRDALICDLAETYGIFDFQALPLPLLATLASGLRDTSRIKLKMAGMPLTPIELYTAAAVDRLSTLVWMKTEDAQNGIGAPKSIVEAILGKPAAAGDLETFTESEDYENEWAKRTGVKHSGV